MSIKIAKLEIENVKRVKAVQIEPTANGLTVIAGRNDQGKTSVLDSITWALGGNRLKPSNAHREGSVLPPNIKIEMSNGLVAERSGKNGDLKVIDPSGNKGGQALLDTFVEELAINLPKFIESSSKEKTKTLLNIIGVGEELFELDKREEKLVAERHEIGVLKRQKEHHANELVRYENVPDDLISASDLIKQQQDILQRNAEKDRKRKNLDFLESENKRLQEIIRDYNEQLKVNESDLVDARKTALDLHDESTEELERNISNIDEINIKIRANLDKEKAEDEAQQYTHQYEEKDLAILQVRKERLKLLEGANLPLPGLSVEDNELTYKGKKWDSMSGSQQLKVATAIVRKLKPECGFVLIDKLEQMDVQTMNEFGEWLVQENLQAIATRVSSGEEGNFIIIEDGYVKGQNLNYEPVKEEKKPVKWDF